MADDDETTTPLAAGDVTILSVLADMEARGFTADMRVTPEALVVCGACGHSAAPGELELDELRRIEGASDPGDMAAVLALTCRGCGLKGTVIVRFGPEAEPQDNIVLRALDDERF